MLNYGSIGLAVKNRLCLYSWASQWTLAGGDNTSKIIAKLSDCSLLQDKSTTISSTVARSAPPVLSQDWLSNPTCSKCKVQTNKQQGEPLPIPKHLCWHSDKDLSVYWAINYAGVLFFSFSFLSFLLLLFPSLPSFFPLSLSLFFFQIYMRSWTRQDLLLLTAKLYVRVTFEQVQTLTSHKFFPEKSKKLVESGPDRHEGSTIPRIQFQT